MENSKLFECARCNIAAQYLSPKRQQLVLSTLNMVLGNQDTVYFLKGFFHCGELNCTVQGESLVKTVMEGPGTVLTFEFLTTNKHSNTTTEMMLHSYVTIKLAGPKLQPSAVETIALFMGNGNTIMLGDLNADKKCAKCKTPGLSDRVYSKCHNLKFVVLGKSEFSGDKVKVCTC